jgi:pilus assembly protein Flp/PilA
MERTMPHPPWTLRAVVTSIVARRDERGATATEYGLLFAFIVVVIVGGITALGGAVDTWYQQLADALADLPP